MSAKVPVTLQPATHVLLVTPGATLAQAIIDAGIPFSMPCGGRGTCGGCAVKVISGSLSPPDEVEQAKLLRAPQGTRLACRARVTGAVTLRLSYYPKAIPSIELPAADAPASVLAVDLGTTTVKVALTSKAPGNPITIVAAPNRQSRFGADVLTRVSAANSGHLADLQHDVTQSVLEATQSLMANANRVVGKIERAVVVGNPVMMSLYCGQEPTLTTSSDPAHEIISGPKTLTQCRDILCDQLNSRVETLQIPGVAGHVGGDLLAGLLMLAPTFSEPVVYVDIGTNTEIAVCDSTQVHVASVPAGPAFEGAGISSGGHFGPGAVTRVWLEDGEIGVEVEGNIDPNRLCGSGLISLINLLRASGHLDESGRMWARGPLRSHFTEIHGQPVFSLWSTGSGPQLTQMDVRAFQAAKGAVLAAIRTMLRYSDRRPVRLVVSGAFGGAVSTDHLRALGFFPADMSWVDVIEDAALLGALQVAQDPEMANRIDDLRSSAIHHVLPVVSEFSAEYISAVNLRPSSGG